MPVYKAPLDDIRFVLDEVVNAASLVALPGYEEATPELIEQILTEAARLCEQELLPLNQSGDIEGCSFAAGAVRTPAGFRQAYQTYIEGGWTGLACNPAYGGQGLPLVLNGVLEELICSANLAFGIYPGLSHGAYNAIHVHGNDDVKRRFLPRLVDGSWAGTMCLTEPQCGTDLGLIRTRAEPDGSGGYLLTGTKIFISAGEHDLTENIIHLVLARLPGAPVGIRGLSLFVVPKVLVNDDGSLGERNAVSCSGIEHKMGIRASATCVINFDRATGWLLGQPHKGMRAMFTMMNEARLAVGIQGLGIAEVAYQNALAYARDRLQGRSLGGPRYPDRSADPLIVHPDIRRMLLTMKAYTEGCRALAGRVGVALDRQERDPDLKCRQEAGELVALLTPVIKALFTDIGFEVANLGMQIWGGHGYIRDNGMEQFVRDVRITQLYEGANGIQALDLVGRKLPQDVGRSLRRFFHPLAAELERDGADSVLAPYVRPLAKAFGRLQQATVVIAQRGLAKPVEAAAVASDYLRLFGLVALGASWLTMVRVAQAQVVAGTATPLHRAKLDTGRFFMAKLLPQTGALLSSIMAGAEPVMTLDEALF
ncbi:3-methylmercaptopropionyl-CoA dehydrogenase [uncultured Gammaproteobacteria bacterium]